MSSTELPPILGALVASRAAWLSPAETALALEIDVQEVDHEIERLRIDGYVDTSTLSSAVPVFTFSAWGAAVLGYTPTEQGARNVYRWIKCAPDPDPPRRRKPRRPVLEDEPAINQVVDERPGPLETSIAREGDDARAAEASARWERGGTVRPEDVPPPSILLWGHGLWHWTELLAPREKRPARDCRECAPSIKKAKRLKVLKAMCRCGRGLRRPPRLDCCTGCKDRPLSKSTLCLRCGRWGWDDFFRPKSARRRA